METKEKTILEQKIRCAHPDGNVSSVKFTSNKIPKLIIKFNSQKVIDISQADFNIMRELGYELLSFSANPSIGLETTWKVIQIKK